MIVESPLPKIVIPSNIGYSDYALCALEKFGQRIALIADESPHKTLTFNQIRELSIRYTIAFQEHGIEKGDIISTCFSNCLEFPVIIFAVAACGAILTTCNPQYTEGEIKELFKNATPKMVIIDHQRYSKIKNITRDFPAIKIVVSVHEEHSLCESLHDWTRSISNNSIPKPVSIDPSNDVLLLLQSSGTTGLPKRIMLTQQSLVAFGELHKIGIPCSTGDCSYISLPLFHLYGLIQMLDSLVQGAKTIIGKQFQTKKFLKLVENFKITFWPAVPPMLLNIYSSPLISKYDLSSLKTIKCSASALPGRIAIDIQRKLNARVFQGYGMSECVMTSAYMYPVIPIHSVGVPLPNMQMKVVDFESGNAVGPNQIGEVCGRGPLMMKGYYKNPAATSQCIDSDGWLHTGDLGYFDRFGFFFIVDRMKEVIKYKGFQVAPAELEEVLLQHPQVKDAAVVGIPDPEAGELPKAFVVKNNPFLTADQIHRFIEGKLAKYKELKGGIEFCDVIPKNETGKILRKQLKSKRLKSNL